MRNVVRIAIVPDLHVTVIDVPAFMRWSGDPRRLRAGMCP
jgi:hypothetical protein